MRGERFPRYSERFQKREVVFKPSVMNICTLAQLPDALRPAFPRRVGEQFAAQESEGHYAADGIAEHDQEFEDAAQRNRGVEQIEKHQSHDGTDNYGGEDGG